MSKDINKISENSIKPNIVHNNFGLKHHCKNVFFFVSTSNRKIKKLNKDTINFKEEIDNVSKRVNKQEKVELYQIYKLNCLY